MLWRHIAGPVCSGRRRPVTRTKVTARTCRKRTARANRWPAIVWRPGQCTNLTTMVDILRISGILAVFHLHAWTQNDKTYVYSSKPDQAQHCLRCKHNLDTFSEIPSIICVCATSRNEANLNGFESNLLNDTPAISKCTSSAKLSAIFLPRLTVSEDSQCLHRSAVIQNLCLRGAGIHFMISSWLQILLKTLFS